MINKDNFPQFIKIDDTMYKFTHLTLLSSLDESKIPEAWYRSIIDRKKTLRLTRGQAFLLLEKLLSEK